MASTDINRVSLVGRLTRDPEIRQIPSGTAIANFSVANNRVYMANNERREDVSYFNCLIWGKAGETFARYAKKGQRVAIDGRLQQRRWQDQEGNNRSVIEIVVDNFQFLSFSQEGGGGNGGGSEGYPPSDYKDNSISFGAPDMSGGSFPDDDIPF
jgi:single-strand DNA-binding protein